MSSGAGHHSAMHKAGESPRRDKHVVFDEDTIREHDKLRGTRQKIDEPNTPFHRGSFDDEDEVASQGSGSYKTGSVEFHGSTDAEVPGAPGALAMGALDMEKLQAKLQQVNDEGSEPQAAIDSKHKDFEVKRKQHYNEFEMMRKWREQHANDDDDDEDEEN